MTTLGGNVSIVAVDGKFDDCQALVKRAFQDEDLHGLNLSSANSINFGRLLPQSVYYTYAYSRLCESPTEPIVFSVPSGNFGDLMGGMIAKRMGLPVRRFLVATNENDEFPSFLKSGEYMPLRPSRACISNAMNVGHPSNLARLFHMYGGWMDETGQVRMKPDIESMRRDLWSSGVSDKETRDAIKDAYERHRLILEPHGAVGWAALRQYERLEGESFAVSLETADPAKFPDEIRSVLGFEPEIPDSLMGLAEKTEQLESMSRDYGQLKRYLLRMAD
jgi:threonine synthase